MDEDQKPNSTNQGSSLPFKPADNPFETENPPTQPKTTGKKTSGLFNIGKKQAPAEPHTTETTINGKETVLVSNTPAAKQDKEKPPTKPKIPEEILISWQAPEFAYTNKPVGWFIGLGAFVVVLIVIAIVTQQWITIVLIAVMGIAVGVWANRKPRTLNYQVSNYGVYVDRHKYLFDSFKAYYVFMDYNQKTLDLVPTKRFGTLVSLPITTPESEKIELVLKPVLPKIEHKEDWIDKIFRKLRF